VRPGGKVCDESGNCLIPFAATTCPLSLVLIRYMMNCVGVFLNFISICHSSDSELIRFVIKNALFYARMQSPIGCNYMLCYERYGLFFAPALKSFRRCAYYNIIIIFFYLTYIKLLL